MPEDAVAGTTRYWIVTYIMSAPRWGVATAGTLHYIGSTAPHGAGLKALAMQQDPLLTATDDLIFTIVPYSADDYYRIRGIPKP